MSEQAVYNPDGLIQSVNGGSYDPPSVLSVHLAAVCCNTCPSSRLRPAVCDAIGRSHFHDLTDH